MSLPLKLYNSLPIGVRHLLKNRFTLLLHRYFVLRPLYVKSIITGITIELTDRCNLACSYCPKSLDIGRSGDDMDLGLFKEVVEQACALVSIQQICLVGFGEPLLYPHLEHAIHYIKSKNPSIRVTITTNGILLNSDWAKRLTSARLDQITISVNATSREQYREINRADLYEKVIANTSAFLETVNDLQTPMRVLIQVLEGPNREAEIKTFRNFWKPKLGKCGEIQIQPFVNWAGIINTSTEAISIDKRYPCAHLQTSWIITREGNALACCMVFPGNEGDLFLGNVKEKSMKELYMEGRVVKLRRMNIEGQLYQLSPCMKCDAYKTVPNVWIKNPFYHLVGRRWL